MKLKSNTEIQADLDVTGTISATGGNSTQWNTAYADRNKWDGGATGLNATTGRASLGLGSLATLNTVNAATITDNSVGAAELNVTGNGTTSQYLRSDGDGTFTWATPPNTTPNNATITINAGGALTGGGSFTTNQSGNATITVNHEDTSSQASVNNSGRTYIQDITLDTYGHITGITSATETVTDTTYSAGNGLTLSGTTFHVNGGNGIKVSGDNVYINGNAIPASVDLNTYRSTGFFTQNANSSAASGTNYPTANAGILQVINDDYGNGLFTTQLYSQYNSTNYYHRTFYNGTWTAWRNLAQDTNTTYTSSDFNHDSLSGFVANEHIDWTTDRGATNIHPNNYVNTTYVSGDFNHNDLAGVVANEHIDWTVDQGATNIHPNNYTDTNTFRPIHDVPVDNATTTSISSNWAFDNVKTPVPAGAVFTDTTYVSSDFNHDDLAGFVAKEHLDWTVDQGANNIHPGNYVNTNTQLSTEQVQDIVGAMFSGNTETRIAATYQDADGTIDLVVDNMNYTLPEATATTRGGIELFSNTDQSVAANAVTATAGRTYGIQLNSSGQAVVNVPWVNTDTNTWVANSAANAGYVAAGAGNNNKVWKTDANGVPAWRDDVDTNTNTWRPVSVDTNGDGSANNTLTSSETLRFKKGSNITLSEAGGVITISSTDTNTFRPIHDTPVNGATTTSISSNWAFDNVKTPVPAGAVFTDNNTWIANSSSAAGYVASGSGQANKVWKTDGSGNPAWRSDANTTYSVATSSVLGLVKVGYTETGKNYPVELDGSNKMYVNVPWTDTNTNTQRSDEEIRDVAAAQWVNGTNTTVVKDDAANTIKINVPNGFSGSYLDLTNKPTLGILSSLNSVSAATITDNSVGAAELNVTGNGTTSTYLRSDGDGTFAWVTPPNTTDFYIQANGGQQTYIGRDDTVNFINGTNTTVVINGQQQIPTVTFNMNTGGIGAGTYGSTSDGTKIDQITVDAYGRVTGVTTGPISSLSNYVTTNTTQTITGEKTFSNPIHTGQITSDGTTLTLMAGGSSGTYIYVDDDSGNVGINTNLPDYNLDVNGSLHSTNINIADAIYHEGDTNTYMQFHAADQWRVVTGGTERLEVNNTQTTVNSGNFIVNNNVGIGTTSPQAALHINKAYPQLRLQSAGDSTYTNIGSGLSYMVWDIINPTTKTYEWRSGGSAQMSIDTSGRVGIGTGSPGYKLDVSGTGRFTSTVTATNFILSSDERKKTKIKDLTCDNINVNWKSFEFKEDEGEYRTGVIAQELEKSHPEFVNTDDEGFKSVKYIDLLIAKIAELENRIKELEK